MGKVCSKFGNLIPFGEVYEQVLHDGCKLVDAFLAYHEDSNPSTSSVPFNEDPIFITPSERAKYEDIRNKTIKEISDICEDMIESLSDSDVKKEFCLEFSSDVLHKKGRKAKKEDYINFHELLQEYLDFERATVG